MSNDQIPLSVPWLAGNEAKYLQECVETGWVSSVGPFVDRFERETAARLGSQAAVAVASGTAALHVALQLAGVQPGEAVLISDLTFIAPANVVRYLGAHPIFIDAEPDYFQLDVAALGRFLDEECRREGGAVIDRATERRVRAIVPVHVLGHPVDMDPLMELAAHYGLAVIEDATECLGSLYKGRPVGTLGRAGCFSYNGNKIITTGGGGMIVTDDVGFARKARYLTTQAKDDPLEFVHGEIGYNYRLTNVQAAIGVAQLEMLDEILERKRRFAERYRAQLGELPGITPMAEAAWATSSWWLYTIRVDEAAFGMSSRALMRALHGRGIDCRPLWQPMHKSPAHAGARAYPAHCPVAEALNRDSLSLPCSAGLDEASQARVIAAIRDIHRGAGQMPQARHGESTRG